MGKHIDRNDYRERMSEGLRNMEIGDYSSACIELKIALDSAIEHHPEALRFTAGMLYDALVSKALKMKNTFDKTANEQYLFQAKESLKEAAYSAGLYLEEIKESAARVRLGNL